MAGIVGRLLCLLGFHGLKVIEATFGFGSAGGTSAVQCQRCGRLLRAPTRRALGAALPVGLGAPGGRKKGTPDAPHRASATPYGLLPHGHNRFASLCPE